MSYTLNFGLSLGASKTGLALSAQLIDSAGAGVGAAVTTGFYEVGAGNYLWSGTIPDKHQGGVKFYATAVPSTILAFSSVNSEVDFNGVLTESYAADAAEATIAQLLYMIYSQVAHVEISGTTWIARKLDGTTQSMKFTIGGGVVRDVTLTRTE